MEIAQKQPTCKIQDALKKRYASTLCACMIHAAKYNDAVINIERIKIYSELIGGWDTIRRRGGLKAENGYRFLGIEKLSFTLR